MNSILESTSILSSYQPALVALTVLCLAVLIQSFLTAPLAFLKKQQVPGMPLKGDHSMLSFRALRTHLNSVESLAPFGFIVIIAILFNTSANVVNWLAIIHVAFRLLFWAVYYSGIGKVAGGIRTLSFVGGLLANLGLVVVALVSIIE